MKNIEIKDIPRVPQRPRLRNDARTLLRSRPVQAVLVAGTLVQVAVLGQRAAAGPEPENHAATAGRSFLPVAVATPEHLSDLRVVKGTAADRAAAKESDRAEALAARYRAKGYRVSDQLAKQIHAAAVKNGIDPAIAFGLVRTESGFKNSATSHVGATGLTQLMPATARWLEPGVTRAELRDSETNLRIGFRYLRDLIRKYDGDTTLALLAYNRGPGTVDRLVRRGRNPDNGYADMVRGLRTTHR